MTSEITTEVLPQDYRTIQMYSGYDPIDEGLTAIQRRCTSYFNGNSE
jgi:hypothetical protein